MIGRERHEEPYLYSRLFGRKEVNVIKNKDVEVNWAIVFDADKYKYVYFIAETKGSMESLQLKEIEKKKIDYARKHFEALGHADIKYDVIDSYQALRDKIMK